MKKKLIVLLFACLLLTGCEDVEVTTTPSISTVDMEYSQFDLICDEKTNIVYIDNVVKSETEYGYKYHHIYTPYYSRNGKLCRFVDGKVVEIE